MKAGSMRWGRGDCEAPQAQLDEKFSLPMRVGGACRGERYEK